jgi:ABC-type branched-subunit amino acid transport system permease subunit
MTNPMGDILSILPQQLVFGLALGTVYALIALGYTMVYGVLMMINFAHGEVFAIGAYTLGSPGVPAQSCRRRHASDLGPANTPARHAVADCSA